MKEKNPVDSRTVSLQGRSRGFVPLLFGNDINVYSLARAFHEKYSLRSTVWGKYTSGPCYNSNIIDYNTCEHNDSPPFFLQNVKDFAEKHRNKIVFLIGCGDAYVRLCSDNMELFPENVIAPYPDKKVVDTLFHKEHFYRLCQQHGIAHPRTVVHRRAKGTVLDLPFNPPFVLKPANPIMYWQCPFPGQKKVYLLDSRSAVNRVLDTIYAAGYSDTMIIQDFIPGDDTYMRVMTGYSSKKGQVELMSLGHVLLEEHTPQGIGNHAVIINEYNDRLAFELKEFLEKIGFTGFFNFDLKYDQRDGVYKILELNVRQGRSNYYVTGAGHNLAEYMVDDHLFNRPTGFTIVREKYLWSVVPRSIMFNYIRAQTCRDEMKMLIAKGRSNNPLHYSADTNFKRRLFLLKAQLGYIYKYHKHFGNSIPGRASLTSGFQ